MWAAKLNIVSALLTAIRKFNRQQQWLLLVVVCHAIDVAVMIDSKRNTVQSLGANHTAEAAGVVRVAEGLQDLRNGENNQILNPI